jgi:hypothetical protein
MFLSYKYQKYLGYDTKIKQYSYQYKIIDSNFEKVGVVGVGFGVGAAEVGVAVAVIDTYEKRNLNVAKNLMLAILYHSKRCGYSAQQIIKYNKQYNPKFAQYEEELNKYLCLV